MKYYPLSRVVTGLKTTGNEFSVDGKPYVGSYYKTFDNQYFTGEDPVTGESKKLSPFVVPDQVDKTTGYTRDQFGNAAEYSAIKNLNIKDVEGFLSIVPYYPMPTETDYKRGFFFRYFAKKRNQNGGLIETTQDIFLSLKKTNSVYNYEIYHAIELYWQLTGPLKDTVNTTNGVRTAGIEDTNKRLTETKDSSFRGLLAHIGGNYSKFSKPK